MQPRWSLVGADWVELGPLWLGSRLENHQQRTPHALPLARAHVPVYLEYALATCGSQLLGCTIGHYRGGHSMNMIERQAEQLISRPHEHELVFADHQHQVVQLGHALFIEAHGAGSAQMLKDGGPNS